jgi:cleavage and polyadenylation specificity factor subunit 3
MVVYQTYIGSMNDNIKRLFRQRMAEAEASGNKAVSAGPWDFRFVRSLRSLERFDDVGGCVMLASPGMLQTGTSRELLERWAPSERNGVVMTGYSVEGTMAKQLLNEPEHIPATMARVSTGPGSRRMPTADDDQKVMIPRRCTVDEISFAAHVDGVENRNFIEEVAAPVVVCILDTLIDGRSYLTRYSDSRPWREASDDAPKIQTAQSQRRQSCQGEGIHSN